MTQPEYESYVRRWMATGDASLPQDVPANTPCPRVVADLTAMMASLDAAARVRRDAELDPALRDVAKREMARPSTLSLLDRLRPRIEAVKAGRGKP